MKPQGEPLKSHGPEIGSGVANPSGSAPFTIKTLFKFRPVLGLFFVSGFALFFRISGYGHTPDETWFCYDTSGHPVGGVLILCNYGLAGSNKSAVNFRFGDASGKVVLNLDKDNPYLGLNRAHVCIYSRQLRNGDVDLGERWHEGQPIPPGPVYFDEWNHKIYIAPGSDEPQAWHAALDQLIGSYSERKNPVGGPKLGRDLYPFIDQERQGFLQKYGETSVPPEYLKTNRMELYHKDLATLPRDNLKFKDITLELEKP